VLDHQHDDIPGSYLRWIGNPIEARAVGTGGTGHSDHDALLLGVGHDDGDEEGDDNEDEEEDAD